MSTRHDTSTQSATPATPSVTHHEDVVRSPLVRRVMAALRLALGFYFLWAFTDKLFGLGYTTPSGSGWIDGGSPTSGFLTMNPAVTEGPFGGLFANFAGGIWDVLFMAGLLGIGLAFLLGAGMKLAAIGGVVLMTLMYLAEFPLGRPDEGFTNPLVDSHWIEGLALVALAWSYAGDTWGLGRWWSTIAKDGWLR